MPKFNNVTRFDSEFTPEELALLGPFDCLAFDLMRKNQTADGKIPPCWLCCSDDARAKARTDLLDWLRQSTGLNMTEERARERIGPSVPPDLVDRWRDAELTYKRARLAGNPRAFFAD